ncbi:hypothetical protein Sjap_003509 [Stephania japonica]|uniref:Uncharacterized protein n=1 Tax=Stephania japonica TaxID=461633 RepID=A0AAP0KRB7_9MAGN
MHLYAVCWFGKSVIDFVAALKNLFNLLLHMVVHLVSGYLSNLPARGPSANPHQIRTYDHVPGGVDERHAEKEAAAGEAKERVTRKLFVENF